MATQVFHPTVERPEEYTFELFPPTGERPDYTFTFSPTRTARFVFTDGTCITLMRQASTVHAIQTALAMRQAQAAQDAVKP